MREADAPRRLGLVGGLGVGATAHYYQTLVRAHAARGAEADLVIAHAHMARVRGLVEAGELDALAAYLAERIAILAGAGARLAAVPAVAPHICAPQLAPLSPLPLVDIVDALNDEIEARRLGRIGLFGTRFAMETALFGRLRSVEVVKPSAAEADFIHAAYMRLAEAGAADAEDSAKLRSVAQRLCAEAGAQSIVLAGTDFTIAFDEASAGFPALDSTRVHVEAIMKRLFEAPG